MFIITNQATDIYVHTFFYSYGLWAKCDNNPLLLILTYEAETCKNSKSSNVALTIIDEKFLLEIFLSLELSQIRYGDFVT